VNVSSSGSWSRRSTKGFAKPVWLVFERHEFLASIDSLVCVTSSPQTRPSPTSRSGSWLAGSRGLASSFRSPSLLADTIYALRLFEP
jgi:hypothetical protein